MVYGQFNYEQIYNRTRARGKKGTLQASDGDGCLMKTLANITSIGVLSAPYFVGNGSNITNTPPHTLSDIIATGNSFSSNTMIASSIRVNNLTTNVGSFTGISNISPIHTLDVGSNFYVTDTGDTRIENLTTNGLYNGISNISPIHALDVGSNFYVTDTGGISCTLNTSDNDDIYPVSFVDTNVNNINNSPILFNGNIGIKPNKGILNIKGYGAAIDLADRTYSSNVWHHHVNSFGSDISNYFVYYQPNGKSFMSFASDGRAAFASMNNNQEYIPSTPSTIEFGSNVAMYDTSPSGYVLKVTGNIYSDGLLTTGTANSGIANVNPVHTLDVGSNLYISDTSVSGNVLVVNGNIFTSGAFQMATLESNAVIFVNSSNILTTDYASLSYDPRLHILRVDDVGGGDLRLVKGGGIFKQTTIKGQAIYTEPNVGNQIHFHLADNGVVANMPCIGLALSDYNNNDTGYIVTQGSVLNLTTASVMVDTLSPGVNGDTGKTVYVSNVAGKLTITRPTNPANLIQNIGIILKVTGTKFDMQILGTGRYLDTPNFIQAARANVYQYVSIGGQMNTSANLYVNGLTSLSNIIVRNTDGAYSIASNTITVNQFGTTYKTFNVSNPPTQIKNIDFTNVIDGAQSILNIRGATDIFLNLSNTTGSSTYTKTSLTSNVVLTSGQRCIVKCITLDSNTFVDFTKYN